MLSEAYSENSQASKKELLRKSQQLKDITVPQIDVSEFKFLQLSLTDNVFVEAPS